MAELVDVTAYLIANYPEALGHELSTARLTKLVYLADWHSCLHNGRQITSINWLFNHNGPFVWDVKDACESHPDIFRIKKTENPFGAPKRQFTLINSSFKPKLSPKEQVSLDYVIEATRKLYWADFINLVYSTHPVASSEKYSVLNLVEKAREYLAVKSRR